MNNIGKIVVVILAVFLFLDVYSQLLPTVKFTTTLGEITVEIDTINAPISANNFLTHVEKGTYKNAVFYRVVRMDNQPKNDVKIEVIQGGVFVEIEIEKIKPIRHETTKETGLKHLNGTISMARSVPGTASTEFFICVGNQPQLDFGGQRNNDGQGFAAFGKVVNGMDVVRNIQYQKDKTQMLIEKVEIERLEILK
ncbi:MAG: peptidylprolyl isomerase [Draconibacterium sp.]|nr:peptidylprolyl isomerase [Draconibacterium sp.]